MTQSPSKSKGNAAESRRGYVRRLGSLLPPEAKKVLRNFGFAEAEIITKWKQIAGPRFGEETLPIRLTFPQGKRSEGTLHILTESAFAPELQHIEPLLIERVNGYYGYAAIGRLVIHQGALSRSAPPRQPSEQPLSSENRETLEQMTERTRDSDLKAALQDLGQQILASKSDQKSDS